MPNCGYYRLKVDRTFKDGRRETGEHNQVFIGSLEQVKEHASRVQDAMKAAHPEETFRVIPLRQEIIGPATEEHIGKILGAIRHLENVANVLSELVAKHVAKRAIMLNPDIASMAADILREAHVRAAQIQSGAQREVTPELTPRSMIV